MMDEDLNLLGDLLTEDGPMTRDQKERAATAALRLLGGFLKDVRSIADNLGHIAEAQINR
jgi:hypothetical protein